MRRRPKKRPPERPATLEEVKAACERFGQSSWDIGAVVWGVKRSLEPEGHAVPEELVGLLMDPEMHRQAEATREVSPDF
jgi:hypothetical protein